MNEKNTQNVETALQIMAILKMLYPYVRPQLKEMVEKTGSQIDNMIFNVVDRIICPECAGE
jgi:preprotein translocase subunit SecB